MDPAFIDELTECFRRTLVGLKLLPVDTSAHWFHEFQTNPRGVEAEMDRAEFRQKSFQTNPRGVEAFQTTACPMSMRVSDEPSWG